MHSADRDHLAAITEGIAALRTSVLWTLLLWIGCVATPTLGGVAWFLLLLASGWRAIGRHRLDKEKYLAQFSSQGALGVFTSLVHAELAVGCCVAFLTVARSFSDLPKVVVVLLVVTQVGWLGLISVNNLLILQLARAIGRLCDEEPVTPLIRFAPPVILGAAACFVPLFFIRLLNDLLPTPLPAEIATGAGLIVAVGCIGGFASVILIQAELTSASDALVASRRTRSHEPQVNYASLRKQRVVDEPPTPGTGDVIPFANDPADDDAR